MFEKFSQWFDRGNPHKAPDGYLCDNPSCQQLGEYRAPKSREQLENGRQDWLWFCLDHIREYNSKWNYYAGMSESEQTQERLADVVWQRPSWPLGNSGKYKQFQEELDDPLGIFEKNQRQRFVPTQPFSAPQQRQADLDTLNLQQNFSKTQLQQRYHALAKQYHPDANQSPEAGIKFREIKEAYERLKKS